MNLLANGAPLFCVLALHGTCHVAQAQETPAKVTYVDHVQPIFRQHCFACHGIEQKKSDLALDSYAGAVAGGASGEVVYAGDLGSSRLWMMVNHEESPEMPLNGAKLPDDQLALIKAWIEGGLLEKGDSEPRKPSKPAVAAFTPTADNRPAGESAMPTGLLREPVLHAPHAGAPTAVATSPWTPLAAVGAAYQISLYHTESGELLGILPFLEGSPYALRFSRDGSMLLAGGGKSGSLGLVALFDVKTGRRLGTLSDELDSVLAADISPDHSLVALGGPRKVVRVYRLADATLAYEITKHTDWVTAMEFSPDGKFLATADRSGGLLLWDAATGRERGDLRGHTEQINAVSWRGDSAILASASEDDTVRVWQSDGQALKSWAAHSSGASSVHFAREGQIVSAGRDAHVKTWQSDGAAIRDVAALEDIALAARFTHDGLRVVASDWRGNVRVFDATSGAQVTALDPNPPTIAMRLAAAEAEVGQLRSSATLSQEQLAAVQQQIAAAEKVLEQARADAASKAAAHEALIAKLAPAEQRLAKFAGEKQSLEQAEKLLEDEKTTARQELALAVSAGEAARIARDVEKSNLEKQNAAVAELSAQLAAFEKLLSESQSALKAVADVVAAKEQEASAADAQVEQIKGRIDELDRRGAELESIRQLREKYGVKP